MSNFKYHAVGGSVVNFYENHRFSVIDRSFFIFLLERKAVEGLREGSIKVAFYFVIQH